MKIFCMLCSVILIIACFDLPINYYYFLRYIVSFGAITVIFKEVKNDVSLLGIAFVMMLILFNPLLPVYLYREFIWIPFYIVAAALFLIYGFKRK